MTFRVILLSSAPTSFYDWYTTLWNPFWQKPPASPSSSQDAETQEIMMRHDRKCSCGGSIRLQTETNLDEHFSHAGNFILSSTRELNFSCWKCSSVVSWNYFSCLHFVHLTQVVTWTTEAVHWLRTSWWEKARRTPWTAWVNWRSSDLRAVNTRRNRTPSSMYPLPSKSVFRRQSFNMDSA